MVSNNMIIAFDLEGTLVDGELLPAIVDELGIRQKLEALTAQAMDGEVDYASSLIKRIELIRGTSIHRVIEISRGLPLQRGALEAVDQVRLLGAHPIIITGGFSVLAGQIARRLGSSTTPATGSSSSAARPRASAANRLH